MARRPLEGLRVADFSWFGAGPIAGQTLATFGAEVIRVESEARIDGLRVFHPFAMNEDGSFKSGYNVSGFFNNFNAGKLSLQLNLNSAKGQEIGYRLIEHSDVFLSNFTPRVIEKWGLGYEKLSEVNPKIIAAYAPMQGLDGPHRDFLGFGAVLMPVAGINELSGFPHRPPWGVGTNYPDYVINPGHTVTAILAAVRHVRRTGKGQRIELSQVESVVNTLGTAVVEFLADGVVPTRNGNRSITASPHGAFRAADDQTSIESPDRWVVVACRTNEHWANLCSVLGHPELVADDRFATLSKRRLNEGALEDLVGSWIRGQRAETVVARLQSAGVPSGVVQNAQDLLERDEHIKSRTYYQFLEHPEAGLSAHDGPAFRLSKTPGFLAGPAPLLGEQTMDVSERVLGLTVDEIADLLADGVLQ